MLKKTMTFLVFHVRETTLIYGWSPFMYAVGLLFIHAALNNFFPIPQLLKTKFYIESLGFEVTNWFFFPEVFLARGGIIL
jgi:hypothetical protein